MVRSLLLSSLLFLSAGVAMAQTVVAGKVVDENGDGLIGATVKVLKGTDFVRGAVTDFNGDYRINLDPGQYNVEFSYTGFASAMVNNVRVAGGQINTLDQTLSSSNVLSEVIIREYKVPLVEADQTSGGQTLTSEQIMNLPTRSINAIVATTAGTTSIDGGSVNIKGSRDNATNYYIDGIRVYGNSVPPVQDIEQLQVITSGLGAEYGDVTGGVISVTTKGPASEYHGAAEVESSYGLDPYGWFLANGNISGPLIKRTRPNGAKETVLGFRMSGQYNSQRDDDPPALPVYYVRDDVRKNLEANPLFRTSAGSIQPIAETYTNDSILASKYNRFENSQAVDLTGKLDLRVTSNIDFSVTGTFRDVRDRFTPGGWQVLNAHNNPTAYNNRYRGIFRFRHRLGNPNADPTLKNESIITNANYQIQFAFERANSRNEDMRHQDRLFDYGYMGRFNFAYDPIYSPVDFQTGQINHLDYTRRFLGFQPGYAGAGGVDVVPNQTLVNYNEFVNPEVFESYNAINGFLLGATNNIWSNMHSNVGLVYNLNSRAQNDVTTIQATTGFDLRLGKTGIHSIQVGILNEQRTQRYWGMAPFGIWTLMDQQVNSHFNGLDTNLILRDTVITVDIPGLGLSITDTVPIYAPATIELADNKFYRAVRNNLGVPINQYVNVNGMSPDQFDLSMFSARELNDRFILDYYGYDYLGNRLEDGITFEDFFTSRGPDGIRNFPVAPLRPLYQAAFIKDKFTFNKMIFSLGMRIERFDLNTKVMKDPYSLYEVMSAKEYYETIPGAGERPGTIGDDFKVYVEGPGDAKIKAFRDGDTWFTGRGVQANDGNVIFGGGVVVPFLRDTVNGANIFSPNFNTASAFADYTPQVNWLPRLAFSFPISDAANFFAHYDVLVQRPPSNWQVTPLDYLYFYSPGRGAPGRRGSTDPLNNANLLPERVVDYEVGFQQRLTQNSAIKFSAYYRELRDMIQTRNYAFIPVIGRYETFGNIDFGTVKGFTVQYDLRRIKNAELRLAYTLQFADGTGSNATSSAGISQRGNIRVLYPLSFDERHNLQAIFDYRLFSGKQYNGPRLFGVDILSNFGANFQIGAVSGRPYTATLRAVRFGGAGITGAINGSRLPWRFNTDMRLEKTFPLSAANKKPLNLTTYFRVQNLFDTRNIVGVYSFSGSPTDDGYLASPEGQSIEATIIQQGRNLQAYRNAYSWALLNADRFTQPRRMFLGAIFEF
jgi:outer membrane receptor protein involved in Fe transport